MGEVGLPGVVVVHFARLILCKLLLLQQDIPQVRPLHRRWHGSLSDRLWTSEFQIAVKLNLL